MILYALKSDLKSLKFSSIEKFISGFVSPSNIGGFSV